MDIALIILLILAAALFVVVLRMLVHDIIHNQI
jgi:hypothetical protein